MIDVGKMEEQHYTINLSSTNALNRGISSKYLLALKEFLSSNGFVRQKEDKYINIVDQGEFKNYYIPKTAMMEFFKLLDECRKKNIVCHFSERQYYEGYNEPGKTASGIMLDFDIKKANNKPICDTVIRKLIKAVFKVLEKYLFSKVEEENTMSFIVCCTQRPQCEEKIQLVDSHEVKYYKDGLHIIIPEIMLEKPIKRYIFQSREMTEEIGKIAQLFGVIDSKILDLNSYCFIALLLGNAKSEKAPYKISGFYNVQKDDFGFSVDRTTEFDDGEKYNLCAEFSLTYVAERLHKRPYNIKAEYQQDVAYFIGHSNCSDEEIIDMKNQLSLVMAYNPEASEVRDMLNILPQYYADEYDEWIKILRCLAQTGNSDYKHLAKHFSQRSAKWKEADSEKILEATWAKYSAKSKIVSDFKSLGYIYKLAKSTELEQFKKIKANSAFNLVFNEASLYVGRLNDRSLAEATHKLVGDKYVTAIPKDSKQIEWYEYITEFDKCEDDEIYKYRRTLYVPYSLQEYIGKRLPKLINSVRTYFSNLQKKEEDKEAIKFYSAVVSRLGNKASALGNRPVMINIAETCAMFMNRYSFLNQLDKDPDVIGVGNGVLRLKPQIELLCGQHGIPISMHTKTRYKPYKKDNKKIIELTDAIKGLFVEKDAYKFIMYYLASTLDGSIKNPILFIFYGTGSNGKTFVLELHNEMLGEYGVKARIELFTDSKPPSNSANSSLMAIKDKRFTYASEPNRTVVINMSTVKELASGGESLSSRELYGKETNFRPISHYAIATNYYPKVCGYDFGVWRRIFLYHFKYKFVAKPNVNNPMEKLENESFGKRVKTDKKYLKAWLSIMSHWYDKLQKKYDGELLKVPKPTIDKETLDYRNKQDNINKFITTRLEKTEDAKDVIIDLCELAMQYKNWFEANVSNEKLSISNVIEDFCNSSLSDSISKSISETYYLQGHKFK